MKTFTATTAFFLAAATTIAALPADPAAEEGWVLRRADEIDWDNVEIVDMQITDIDAFPGETFTGTAQSVYEQITTLNPEAFANVTNVEDEPEKSLEKRASFNCNWGSMIGSVESCREGFAYLRKLGSARCGVNANKPGGTTTCARSSCSNSCGMFVCNKTTKHYWAKCSSVANDAEDVAKKCHQPSLGWPFHGAKDFSDHYIGAKWQSC